MKDAPAKPKRKPPQGFKTKICPCGQLYSPNAPNQQFCSMDCRIKFPHRTSTLPPPPPPPELLPGQLPCDGCGTAIDILRPDTYHKVVVGGVEGVICNECWKDKTPIDISIHRQGKTPVTAALDIIQGILVDLNITDQREVIRKLRVIR